MALFHSKGPIFGILILVQLGIIIGGTKYYENNKIPHAPHIGLMNQANNKHVSYVDTSKDAHSSAQGIVHADGFNKKAYGSYVHKVPPLSPVLQKYYMIEMIVNVKPSGIYQQFNITPIKKSIPANVQKRLQTSSLLRAVRHYNVYAHKTKTAKNSHSVLVTYDHMNYDKAYNQKSENYHFIHGKPFVIPPIVSHKRANTQLTFTKNGLTANGTQFKKITSQQAKDLLEQGKTNIKTVGY